MGTPFVTFLGPSKLDGYMRGKPHDEQPAHIPKAFVDAMEVREQVFVQEQSVPIENEFDDDDPRACHWIVYASVNTIQEAEVRDEDGKVVQQRRSSTRSTPIGTVRIVPFPHEPHPVPEGQYWNGVLKSVGEEKVLGQPLTDAPESGILAGQKPQDRATTFHDGKEPYLKIGRLAVVKEFRGHMIAKLLATTVLSWLKSNPSFFDPSVAGVGLAQLGVSDTADIPRWTGLLCAHSQEAAVGFWAKYGFQVDEGMGKWWEEAIPHVGMFQRLHVEPKPIKV
jgi:predicted GNAT family N-acyltransferase